MAVWDDVLGEADRTVYAKAGYGRAGGLGSHPALAVIDMTYAFTGDRPEPILCSIERWPNSCGEAAWAAVGHIARLLEAARAAQVPVIYTRNDFSPDGSDAGRWAAKAGRVLERPGAGSPDGFVAEVAPRPGDVVLKKDKPSAFFGTPLMSHLNGLRVDTLLVAGCTTSGCVRATVVDAFSYNIAVGVVAEAVFDRGELSHKVNLFDMAQKYADVLSSGEASDYLEGLGRGSTGAGCRALQERSTTRKGLPC